MKVYWVVESLLHLKVGMIRLPWPPQRGETIVVNGQAEIVLMVIGQMIVCQ